MAAPVCTGVDAGMPAAAGSEMLKAWWCTPVPEL